MELCLHKKLHSVAKCYLKMKKMSTSVSLNLAAKIIAVDCGLKPCFLYDYSTSGVQQIRSYIKELQHMRIILGHLLILNIAENILIINVSEAVSYLQALLHDHDLHLIDVSASLSQPVMFSPNQVLEIRTHIADLLDILKQYQHAQPDSVSVDEIQSPGWNLCTMFGFLLHFPAPYWFSTVKGFDNCLSLTPLRHFSVQANCSRICHQAVQIYSFTVPECVYQALKLHLEKWTEWLRQTFHSQTDFTDLNIVTDTVILTAVAL
ncbi:hypothetical protein GDO86_003244 [Hymenochirus boettgeri]|uniref:Uncharacterized protein n=1 Tax=Hymenochirus boettgeri TaxID=247094 RepID=A0A8T2K5I2_9PIPI|nr:hypothetical protein GDO86_003244 [Hymenochirus boettgeri]